MRKAFLVFLISLLSLSNSACNDALAYGDANALIVVTTQDIWTAVQDSVYAVLSPDVFTLRDERTFRVTYQEPSGIEWQRLSRFKEEVIIGSPDDPWIAEALATLDDSVAYTVPGVVEATDVWARNQFLNLILVDPERDVPMQVYPLLEQVHTRLEGRFRQGAKMRMFVSGPKESLADSLRQHAGFTLTIPDVYRWYQTDSFYTFRNDNPDPSELIREFVVTWRTPIPAALDTDSLMSWKEAVSQEVYTYPQQVKREGLMTRNLKMGEMDISEVRGAWSNPPGSMWPAAGPFIFWSVACPEQDRLYYLDAWLYAPGKDKWEYILQLETIMGTFRCGSLAQ